MGVEQPTTSDTLDSPDHSKLHRVIAASVSASDESLTVDDNGNTKFVQSLVTKTNDYVATADDVYILIDASSNTVTITLPTASGITGRVYNIKCIDATYTATVDGDGSETIDGSTTKVLSLNDNLKVVSDGTNWRIM